ncbi:hypothetical protein [uncultured Nostoc sp.]|uniref:hypothetical protein n=1 Tax=uncultured Nostoc sp. TaxID=340711 RepID=UPI0035CAF09D
MEKRYASPEEDTWQTRDFHCLEIAAENYLVTYTLIPGTHITRRSTIWRQTPQGWKIVYHQGSVVENGCIECLHYVMLRVLDMLSDVGVQLEF